MRDFRNDPKHPECHGIEPVIVWVIGYDGIPIQVQGFLGAYNGRPDDLWCPEARFTTAASFTFDRAGAIKRALEMLAEDQARLTRRAQTIHALAYGKES